MNEKDIQEAVQDTLQSMSEFDDAEVVINDWHVVDMARDTGRRIVIKTADSFESTQDSQSGIDRLTVLVGLFEPFQQSNYGWKPTMDNFRDGREAIVEKFRDGFRSPASSATRTVTINTISNDGPIVPYYDQYVPEEYEQEQLPVYLYQWLAMDVEEY